MRIDREPPPIPPWMDDPEPDTWVPLSVAARLYFRKSYGWVWEMLNDGTLEEAGFRTFFFRRWFIKLPCPIPREKYAAKSQ